MKERLEKIKREKRRVKLIFEYPNSKSAKIRRGIVIEVRESSFDFKEDRDGLVTYSYKYLVEIK
jgi:hypothetical protein